jgi:iron only hydrogenase large subunit-like protein
MPQYFHAHRVVSEICRGHMTCMRQCPTQAIRVRKGKSTFNEELCIDCGNCLAVCPSDAIAPITDFLGETSSFKYKVMVPSPVLYAQFDPRIHPYVVHQALRHIGFDEVIDVTTSSFELARAYVRFIKDYSGRLPLISSDCPCIVRLIQVKYPDLVELIAPFDVPREITARELRKSLPQKLNLDPRDIGIFYMATCPAKIVSVKQPAEKNKSWFDGVIPIRDIYAILLPHVAALAREFHVNMVPADFSFNADWVTTGNMTRAGDMENWMAVSGIDHVVRILDDIENSRLRNITFIEAYAHMLGCVGGAFNIENPYVARANSIRQGQKYSKYIEPDDKDIEEKLKQGYFFFENPVLPRPTQYFDTDLATSIKRLKERERIYQKLPQIDCGVCGSPTCMAFAEDLVRETVKFEDCIFLALPKNK